MSRCWSTSPECEFKTSDSVLSSLILCRYIYNHTTCGRCKSPVSTWSMAARTVYACETCQPLLEGTELAASRKTAMAASRQHEVQLWLLKKTKEETALAWARPASSAAGQPLDSTRCLLAHGDERNSRSCKVWLESMQIMGN